MKFSTILCHLVFIASATCSRIDSIYPTVEINDGRLQGRLARTVSNRTWYYIFQGIPYAEPPVGNLRFEPPVPKRPWNGTFKALSEGKICLQDTTQNHGFEDCLFINVYIPKVDHSELLPVMSYIHPGCFQYGNSTYDLYGPDYLLDEEIIVITFNYRLGLFGFLSTEDLAAPGNIGLKDQLLALNWIQKNIVAFGGDPDKITLYGNGAGSESVSYHIQSPKSKGLFRAAILQSGVSLCIRALIRKSKAFTDKLAGRLIINNSNTTEFIKKLKKVNVSKLQLAAWDDSFISVSRNDPTEDILFGPVLEPEHEGAFLTKNSYEILKSGNFSRVPCIIGFTSLEMGLYPGFFLLANLWSTLFDFESTKLVPIDLNVTLDVKPNIASILKTFYFTNTSITGSEESFRRFLSDKHYVRPIREYIRLIYKLVPVYFYQFSYEGVLGGVPNRPQPGVPHAEDLNYVWYSKYNPSPSDQDTRIRTRIVSYWTSFVKYLDPTPNDQTWKQVDNTLRYLDINNKVMMKQYPQKSSMELWDAIYSKYGYRSFEKGNITKKD